MPYLMINSPGTVLSIDQTHYTLRCKGRKIGRIPPTMVDGVVIDHGVEVTRKALGQLGQTGVSVTFLDREGRVQARMVPGWRQDASARLGQAAVALDPEASLAHARVFVNAKIRNQAAVLRAHLRNHPDESIRGARRAMAGYAASAASASSHASLLGFEGMAARTYFSVFGNLLRSDWVAFKGRNRRPPLDPVNAALSYAYAILHNRILSMAETIGLDPCIGCLHPSAPRRASFVLDFMEPFRPALVDRFVISLFNRQQLRAEHFEEKPRVYRPLRPLPDDEESNSESPLEGDSPDQPPPPAVYLNREGRDVFAGLVARWFPSVDEELDSSLRSPDGLITRDIQAFQKLASARKIHEFTPYLMPDA